MRVPQSFHQNHMCEEKLTHHIFTQGVPWCSGPSSGNLSPSAREYRYSPCCHFWMGGTRQTICSASQVIWYINSLAYAEANNFLFVQRDLPYPHHIHTWTLIMRCCGSLRSWVFHTSTCQTAGNVGLELPTVALPQWHFHSGSSARHCAVTHPRHSAVTHPWCLHLQVKQPALGKCSFPCPGKGNVQSVRQHVLNWQYHIIWELQHMHGKKNKCRKCWRYTWGQVPISLELTFEHVAWLYCFVATSGVALSLVSSMCHRWLKISSTTAGPWSQAQVRLAPSKYKQTE